jgi:formylglycine-generating enzyme required for sulfatase activity
MLKKKYLVRGISVVVAAGVLYYLADRVNYLYRNMWHTKASMQDLPPVDRSRWPKQPMVWSNETIEVEAATPTGLKRVRVTYFVNSIGMKLVRIEPGTFRMGLPDTVAQAAEPGSPPSEGMFTEHEVRLTHPYYLGVFEVMNNQYELFDPSHKHHRPFYQRGDDYDNHPVEPVSWQAAQEFCRWLSAKEGRLYRLPTEAEWEYACRAGTTTRTYWGDDFQDRTKANVGGTNKEKEHAHWRDDGYEYTAPVGSFPPNPWGLYDMIGNSWEWVGDWYAPFKVVSATAPAPAQTPKDMYGNPFTLVTNQPLVDPHGPPMGHCRVAKGLGWSTSVKHVCSALRDGDDPGDLKDDRGFRIACEVE